MYDWWGHENLYLVFIGKDFLYEIKSTGSR
jgi:hypothetical protein